MATTEGKRGALWQKILAVLLAVIIAGAAFAAGWVARTLSQNKQLRSYQWALETIRQNYIGEFDEEQASALSLKGLATLLDDYSAYYTAEEYEALLNENAGARSGIGVTYQFVSGRGVLLVSVIGNSPADLAGLKSGDELVRGRDGDGNVTEFTSSAAFAAFIGRFDTDETFTVVTSSGDEVELAKAFYTSSYTTMSTNASSWVFRSSVNDQLYLSENVKNAMDFLPDGVAYVSLSQFYGSVSWEFGKLIEKFNALGCTSLILDLRNNGGGYVDDMRDIAGYFTSSLGVGATAMTAKFKNGSEVSYSCYTHTENLVSTDTQIYVLANAGTASASEALIGVLVSYEFLDYRNIFLSDYGEEYLAFVGAGAKTGRTYGKGIMQSPFQNPSTGEVLKLTTATIYWQNEKCIHGVGLTAADGCTLVPATWVVTAEDEELQRVVEIIKSR